MSATKSLVASVQFGAIAIPSSQLFILRKHTYALINHKPLAQGHVLVCSKRVVPKLADLSELETLEFWMTVQEVSKVLNDLYKANCQIAVQNGRDAGQSIEHVHCHIIPQSKELDGVDMESMEPRSAEDMCQEALRYRPYFEQSLL